MAEPILSLQSTCKSCGVSFVGSRCKICKRLHDAKYRIKNKEKINERNKQWAKNHPLEAKASKARYRDANAEKIRTALMQWRKENVLKIRADQAVYRAANLDLVRIHAHNRRALIANSGGKLSKGLAKKLFELQKGMCPCCGDSLGEDYHMDHKIPLALGGSNVDDNIQLLRPLCNAKKGVSHPVDFMQSKGFLI